MKHLPALLFALSLGTPALAADCAPGSAKFAGLYTLCGVMEVGSQIMLRADGSFEYMLAYGALDELAQGCWSQQGAKLVLRPSKAQSNDGKPMFSVLELSVESPKRLRRQFDATHAGVYERR